MALHSWGKPPIPVDDLSTVTSLYASGKLDASIATPSTLPPSAKLNDMVVIVQMDLTRLACDAIVNAANKSLLGGGGIDGAIHRVAGDGLYRECLPLRGCETGKAKITKGYKLPARHVIHTVGPIYWDHKDEGEDPSVLLQSCYVSSLELARKSGCETIAFPCISTGIYGYPSGEAAFVAAKCVREYLEAQENEEEEEKEEVKEEEKDEGVDKVKPTTEGGSEKENGGEKSENGEVEGVKKEGEPVGNSGAAAADEAKKESPYLCKIKKVVFCTFLEKDMAAYDNAVPAYFPPVEGVEGSLDKLELDSQKRTDSESSASPDNQEQTDKKD